MQRREASRRVNALVTIKSGYHGRFAECNFKGCGGGVKFDFDGKPIDGLSYSNAVQIAEKVAADNAAFLEIDFRSLAEGSGKGLGE